jgi:hypothetical protein
MHNCLLAPVAGEPFEPSKGTRGIMERWKGARLAHKEKDRWDTATGRCLVC